MGGTLAKRDKSTSEIQRLLAERRKVEQWLDRLRMAADKTSADVRERVEADYQARLDQVNGKLQEHVGQIRDALDTHRTTYDGLKEQEDARSKELAEAELRHAVGEYAEETWRERKADILEALVTIREGLAEAEEEIEELEEVLATLEGRDTEAPDEAGQEPPAAAAPQRAPEAEADEDEEDLPPVDVDQAAAKRASAQTDAFGDELEFLKSVTEDEEQGPAADRASGFMPSLDQPAEPSHESVDAEDIGAGGVEAVTTGASRKGPQSGSTERTLKCGECGTMNLPTEWYCERCGAELAAL